jgi:RNA polymerase sigma-70 factor (ECF subfamily)
MDGNSLEMAEVLDESMDLPRGLHAVSVKAPSASLPSPSAGNPGKTSQSIFRNLFVPSTRAPILLNIRTPLPPALLPFVMDKPSFPPPSSLAGGDSNTLSLDAALPALYEQLHELAAGYMRRERSGHTLQPTALVHEAYLRLLGQREVDWNNRTQILGVAAHMMRRVLINHAAGKAADKRGGSDAQCVLLDEALHVCEERAVPLAALEGALRRLEAMDPRQGQIVELRFFGGLTVEEVAEVLGVSAATVHREWSVAKRWLRREIAADGG